MALERGRYVREGRGWGKELRKNELMGKEDDREGGVEGEYEMAGRWNRYLLDERKGSTMAQVMVRELFEH